MPNIDITSINYVLAGDKQRLVNIDVSTDVSASMVGAKSRRNMTFFTDECLDKDSTNPYNSHRFFKSPVLSSNDGEEIIYALFDVKDEAIKSSEMKERLDSDIILRDKFLNDIYAPRLEDDPIGFCQLGNGDFLGLTKWTTKTPFTKTTNLDNTRPDRLSGTSNSMSWVYKLENEDAPTYVYVPLSKLELKHKPDDPLSSYYPVSSYWQYIQSYGTMSAEALENLFMDNYNLSGISKNYIFEMPTNDQYNDHNNAILRSKIYVGKNAYDAEYSMNMPSQTELDNAREYIGIGNCAGIKTYKYYDETSYDGKIQDDGKTIKMDQTPNMIGEDGLEKHSYQNIEYHESSNRYVNNSYHPSNMYSIKIEGLKFPENKAQSEEVKNKEIQVKEEIANSIRAIAKHLQPAHTQLFKVFFDEDHA